MQNLISILLSRKLKTFFIALIKIPNKGINDKNCDKMRQTTECILLIIQLRLLDDTVQGLF